MKKLIICLCLFLAAMGAKAQFEQGKWIINPSVTGLNLSYSESEDTRFGISAQGGAFIVDNVAIIGTLGADWAKGVDVYTIGGGGRYYFSKLGLYVGGGLKLSRYDGDGGFNDFAATAEAGYAFFLTRTVTIEPAVYCNLSFKDADYSKVGLKVGFGFYF